MVASLGAFDMLEPYTVKIVRAVLRGRGGGDATLLPGAFMKNEIGCAVGEVKND